MTVYSVASDGSTNPTTPPFPQPVINDVLQPDGSYDTTSTSVILYADGAFTLQSLYIGPAVEVDLGVFSSATLTGTGNITGSNDQTNIPPAFVNYGMLDINGSIDIALTNSGQIAVSAGERLDIEGDLNRFGAGASTITVATGAELDLNSTTLAATGALSSTGTIKATAPTTILAGATTLGGSILVQGDATNGAGQGNQVARTAATNGAYTALLDLRQATLSAPISSLTLGTDAQIHFGTAATTIRRFAVTGSATALQPLDLVTADGPLAVTGDGTGVANQVSINQAEFAGGSTVDFTVAASDGGANLQRQITVDAGTTLRNDGKMTIGTQGGTTAALGAATAAAGSSFINGSAGQLTLAGGASLSVASLQNAGAITVAGSATVLAGLTNTGTVDVTSGTLSLEAASTGAGSITVENGANLSIDAASSQTVALKSGSLLRLSQPTSFTGTLQMPALEGRIDLAGITVTAATVNNGAIAVTSSAGTFNLAETGLINGTTVAFGSDGAGGSLLSISANTQSHPVAYRFFDSIHGTQFLTTSLTETQSLQSSRPDLVYEGVGLAAANPSIDPAASPVYRFFDSVYGTHFYTASLTERNSILASRPDLVSEGIGFYEHTTQQAGDVSVFRYFESTNGTHFYTASATEAASIAATRPDLVSEGVGFYAPSLT